MLQLANDRHRNHAVRFLSLATRVAQNFAYRFTNRRLELARALSSQGGSYAYRGPCFRGGLPLPPGCRCITRPPAWAQADALAFAANSLSIICDLLGNSPNAEIQDPMQREQRARYNAEQHSQAMADARRLAELARQLQDELEHADGFTLPADTFRKADEIIKLAKSVKGKMQPR